MLVVKEAEMLALKLDNPQRVLECIPTAKQVTLRGHPLVVLPHKPTEVQVLRNLGIKAPAPILHYYDWPGDFSESNMFADDYARKSGFHPFKCQAGRYYCVVQTNGDLYSCDPLLGFGENPPNCLELGFKEAFERISTHNCVACNTFVNNEYHQLFGLRIPVIRNLVRNYGGQKSWVR